MYPTFFGSGSLVYDPLGAVIEAPIKRASNTREHLEKMASLFGGFIKRHPDKNFAFYFVERNSTTEASPAYGLTSDVADYRWFQEHFLANLPDTCTVFDGSYSDTGVFFEDHFTTDHHWQVEGAVKAYRDIVTAFGKEPVQFQGFKTVYPAQFWGSMAREGLCVEGEGSYVDDVVYDRSPLKVTVGGMEKDESFLDAGYAEDGGASFQKKGRYGSVYAQWFHEPTKPIVMTNEKLDSGSLLIIGDSSTDSSERFYAENYRTVHKVDPRYLEGTLDEYLDENEVDDIVFVFNETQYDKKDVRDALKKG